MAEPGAPRLRVLLLCDDRRDHANTVLDHIAAFRTFSRHEVKLFNPVGLRDSVALDLDEFDAVVIHYSLILLSDSYVAPALRDKLSRYRGLKVQFIQDEYRWVDRTTAASRKAGINVLFTCAPEPAAGQLYDERLPGVRRVETLTGYVPRDLEVRAPRPLRDRELDVAYRGRDLPYWLGRLTQEKTRIALGFQERAALYGLRTDIGWREEQRIYGERWIGFISSARATLGTESGASIADFDGSAEAAVKAYLRQHPRAEFEEVHHAVLQPYEGNVVINVISPRVFEAAALGTALVLFPGTYSGVVEPGRHYIVLEKDFSNMEEVARQIKDDDVIAEMTQRTRADLVASGRWSYASFIAQFDDVISEESGRIRRSRHAHRYRLALIERPVRLRPRRVMRRAIRGASRASGGRLRLSENFELTAALRKAFAAVQAVLRDPSLQQLYEAGRQARMPRRALLIELLRFSMLRQALLGQLPSSDEFFVGCAYDPSSSSLRFASEWGKPIEAPGLRSALCAALTPHKASSIEWDHSGVATAVKLRRPRIEVDIGLGREGREDFPLINEIGRCRPEVFKSALSDVLDRAITPASVV